MNQSTPQNTLTTSITSKDPWISAQSKSNWTITAMTMKSNSKMTCLLCFKIASSTMETTVFMPPCRRILLLSFLRLGGRKMDWNDLGYMLLWTIIYSGEVEGQTVFYYLLCSYFLLLHLYYLVFCRFFMTLSCILFLFNFFWFFRFLYFLLYFLNPFTFLRLFINFFRPLMNFNTNLIPQFALPFKKSLTNLCFVFIVFLLQIHIPVIIPTGTSKITFSLLIQFTNLLPIFKWFSQFLLIMSIIAAKSMPTIHPVDAHFCLQIVSFLFLENRFIFGKVFGNLVAEKNVIYKFSWMLLLCLRFALNSWALRCNVLLRIDRFLFPHHNLNIFRIPAVEFKSFVLLTRHLLLKLKPIINQT